MQHKRRVTIYDIAKSLGISASYISKALNHNPIVSTQMVEKVQQKAIELGYIHNSNAANLRKGKSRIIGVIVPHVNKSIFANAISGIEETCSANGHGVILCQSHESRDKEQQAIDLLVRQNVDCILISVSAETKSPEYIAKALKSGIEVIQFDRYVESSICYRVVNNDAQIAETMTAELLKRGYTNIAFMGGPKHSTIYSLRKEGYRKALTTKIKQIPSKWIQDDVLDPVKARETARKWLMSAKKPDAIIAIADQQAWETLCVARDLGIKVPENLAIVSFGNESFTKMATPTLTSVDQKSAELGRRAAKAYFHKMQKGEYPSIIGEEIVDAEVIWRESTNI